MPSVDLMAGAPPVAPPIAPPEAAIPPTDVQPRTERFDWIFVGYPWAMRVTRNAPLPALRVADAAEVPAAVAAWIARGGAEGAGSTHKPHPYIWLAPELAADAEDRSAPAATARVVKLSPPR